VLQRAYFEKHVLPNDPVMKLAGKVLPASGLLVLYRFGFVFGVTRLASWLIFAHVIHTNAFDLSWGGPDWVTPFG
jgi:hypothetical protein